MYSLKFKTWVCLVSLMVFSPLTGITQEETEVDTAYYEPDVELERDDTASMSFADFITLFRTAGITSLEPIYTNSQYVLNRIPDGAVDQYIGLDDGFTVEPYYYAKELLLEGDYLLVVYVVYVPVGPGLEKVVVRAYDKEGSWLSGQLLGENYTSSGPDGEGEETVYTFDPTDTTLKVVHTITSYNMETEQEETRDEYEYYEINTPGDIILLPGRLYPNASINYLSETELAQYTKEELLIMRNEIFADHGYIFKTEPLKSYFGKQKWYTPLYDSVDGQLTEIEEENLKLILAAEKKLKK